MQDVLRTSFESLLVPAFEQSCKTMFEQVDSAFQKGMSEHAVAIQQQVEAAHTPLALTLKVGYLLFGMAGNSKLKVCIFPLQLYNNKNECLYNYFSGNYHFCVLNHPESHIRVT